jgi:hypothetical protein
MSLNKFALDHVAIYAFSNFRIPTKTIASSLSSPLNQHGDFKLWHRGF